MVFQFDYAPLSLSRKTSSPLFSIFADREPAGLLFESASECTIGQKNKIKYKITLLDSWNLVALFLAPMLLCHVVLHFSGIHSSVALSANFLFIASFYEQMGGSLSFE